MTNNSRESKKGYYNNEFSFINRNMDTNTNEYSDQKPTLDQDLTVISHSKIAQDSHLNDTNIPNYEISSNSFYGRRNNTKFSTEDYAKVSEARDFFKNSIVNQSCTTNPTKNYGKCDRATNDTAKSMSKSRNQ